MGFELRIVGFIVQAILMLSHSLLFGASVILHYKVCLGFISMCIHPYLLLLNSAEGIKTHKFWNHPQLRYFQLLERSTDFHKILEIDFRQLLSQGTTYYNATERNLLFICVNVFFTMVNKTTLDNSKLVSV